MRYKDINLEIENRKNADSRETELGIKRFITGFAKKIFLANSMGNIADTIFSMNQPVNTIYAWVGAICYSFQIFYDFSAYSDMAIGLGLMFGFHFNENFNHPYISKSIKEFWRRWHISLSTWFRDYVYIPLGGNRKGQTRTYVNLAIVFLLTGLWHGADWQFIIWGLWHGLFLILERLGWGRVLEKLPNFIRHIYTMLVVIVGWVFFRADDVESAFTYLNRMFAFDFTGLYTGELLTQISLLTIICFIISTICAFFCKTKDTNEKYRGIKKQFGRVVYIILYFITIAYMTGTSYNPFIYFKF